MILEEQMGIGSHVVQALIKVDYNIYIYIINKQTGQIARMKADDIRLKDSNWTRFHRRLGIGLDYLH